jgi:orotidine-5'-phosphate decarboxylase
MPKRRIAFALDYPDLDLARAGLSRVEREIGVVKVGLELFAKEGPRAFELGRTAGLEVFADLKLHDIPETVARAMSQAARLGAELVTVHAGGGPAMLEAAVKVCAGTTARVLAVTVLTSMDERDLAAIGAVGPVADLVARRAALAASAGCHGVVASPQEAAAIRAAAPAGFLIVTPGVRPAGTDAGDQKRIATPAAARKAGADLVVVGRPIRDAADPAAAARAIAHELADAL